jgi:ADP-ribose pyrophosphatase YjhB (NUDIX family)
MVGIDRDQARFNFRVAGVAIQNGRILLDRNAKNTYWVLPGGHPEMMEPMAQALRREVREEIGVDVKVVRLLWMLENFFHKSKDIHELSFYFLMQIEAASHLLQGDGPFFGQEHDHQLIFQWFPLDESVLTSLPLFPGYLAHALLRIPETPQHIVFNDFSPEKELPKSQEVPKTNTQRLTIP